MIPFMRSLLREPLVHFLALGALFFLLFSLRGDPPPDDSTIEVTPALRASIVARFERTWNRLPSPEEEAAALDAWVREEILYREGLALGLDDNDPVLRGRIAQKMLLIAEAPVDPEPTGEKLEQFYRDNREAYRRPVIYSLSQLFVAPSGNPEQDRARVDRLQQALKNRAEEDVSGDATLLPRSLRGVVASYVESVFGAEFAGSLRELPVGEWQGPVTSTFGLHLVRIDERAGGGLPELAAVRERVLRDWDAAERDAQREAFIERLRERYTIRDASAALSGTRSGS
jgi:hypothetical protein